MSKIYGYVRISTKKQSLDRQVRNIKAQFKDALIVEEIYTGTSNERPELKKLISRVKSGDVIVFDSVSRLSRQSR